MNADALRPDALYLSPARRLCRLVPPAGRLCDWTWFEFQYVDHDGQVMPGTFTLTRANLKLVREVGRYETAVRGAR
jgi:hypothetical protein